MITKMIRPLRPTSGLTLMELLISLALLALIALGITSSLGFGLRIYDRSEQLAPQTDPVIYRLHLRHWLAGATPASLLTPFPAHFEGSSNSVKFVTLAETPYFPQASALQIDVAATGTSLSLSISALADDGSVLETLEKVLANNLTDARFDYLTGDQEALDWVSEWNSEDGLPRAVRITANPGSKPDWPDFIVRLVNAPPLQ